MPHLYIVFLRLNIVLYILYIYYIYCYFIYIALFLLLPNVLTIEFTDIGDKHFRW